MRKGDKRFAEAEQLWEDGEFEKAMAIYQTILADDNIVEASLAGVLESGARVPQDLEIAAYCNFPWTPKTPLPIRTLGFHARQIVEACLDLIDRKRSGQPVPRTHRLTVLDEEAVSAAETMETRRVEENEHVAR